MEKIRGILLLGPTAAGKTPLGDRLERDGLGGRRCRHFDFGANLRAVSEEGEGASGTGKGERARTDLMGYELEIVRSSLATGALLEDENFPIAKKILSRFVEDQKLSPDDLLILNGLPRHAGQARDLGKSVDVIAVVSLAATAEVLAERIRCDTGGDRAGRIDDQLEAVAAKLRIFEERTLPLIEYYRSRGIPIVPIPVKASTRPDEMIRILESRLYGTSQVAT